MKRGSREQFVLADHFFLNTYKRFPVLFVKGKGQYLWDQHQKKYLDFFSGLGVCSLGHCHQLVAKAICRQAFTLLHVSNLYYCQPQIELAGELSGRFGGQGKVFFSNSGAEANEGAIKLARKWGNPQGKNAIISFENSFHGRTLAALAATGQKKFHQGFQPLPGGFVYARFNDLNSVEKLIGKKTCAIIVEPIQGEGGVNPANPKFLAGLRKICQRKKILLIFDEIQCGVGRSGRFFAYEHYKVKPDIVTLAKGIAGGLPLGVTIAGKEIAAAFQPGDHGSTFGGNPVSCVAALVVIKTIDRKFLQNVQTVGKYLTSQLGKLKKEFSFIHEIRGKGLMVGMELTISGKEIVKQCLESGLIINCTREKVLRFLPPLIINKSDVDEALKIFRKCLSKQSV
ncbi:MAG: aspartate aminotransferase family protein [Elusimicrobiota bacterium]